MSIAGTNNKTQAGTKKISGGDKPVLRNRNRTILVELEPLPESKKMSGSGFADYLGAENHKIGEKIIENRPLLGNS